MTTSSTCCSSCNSVDTIEYDNVGGTFTYVCRVCGHVEDENIIATDKIEFSKNDSSHATVQGQNYSYRDTQLGGYLMGSHASSSSMNRGFGYRKNVISEAIRSDPGANALQRQSKARSQVYDRINKICYALKMPDYSTEQVKFLLDQMIRNHNTKMVEKYKILNNSQGNNEQEAYDESYEEDYGGEYGEDEYYEGDDFEHHSYSSHSTNDQATTKTTTTTKKHSNNALSKRKFLSFTQTKRMQYILAACIYITCRQSKKPITLLDIAEQIQLNVFKLGKEYKNVLTTCRLSIEVLEPEILVEKFINEGLYSDPPLFEKMELSSSEDNHMNTIHNSNMNTSSPTCSQHGNDMFSTGSGTNATTTSAVDNNNYFYNDYINDNDEYMYQDTYDGMSDCDYYGGVSGVGVGASGFESEIMTELQMHELMSVTVRLVRLASKEWINTGRKPQAIVGAAIKICAEAMGFKVRFDQLAKRTASGQVALRDRHREMLALLTTLSSSLPWAKNLNQKMIQKQLPFLLQYCEALRELHRAKIDFSIKNEDVKEEQEVIVLSDSEDESDDAVVVVSTSEASTDKSNSSTSPSSSNPSNFVIPEDYLIKASNVKTRIEALNDINKLVFSGSQAMPHSFVKSQIEVQRRRMKIRQARSRLSRAITSNTKREPKKEEESDIFDTSSLHFVKEETSNQLSPTLNNSPTDMTNHTTPAPFVITTEDITSTTVAVNTKKRTLDAEDLEIQRMLLEGVNEQALESGNYLLRSCGDTAIPLSEHITEQDMGDEEVSSYLKSQEEVDIYRMLYRDLGEDIDGEITVARMKRKKRRLEQQNNA